MSEDHDMRAKGGKFETFQIETGINNTYQHLLEQISSTYTLGCINAVQAVNAHLIETYWRVGQHRVRARRKIRSEYGKSLINSLATDLNLGHGKGFSRSNLVYMRVLYLRYPINQKPSHQLSWSHYVELLKLDDDLERSFHERLSTK